MNKTFSGGRTLRGAKATIAYLLNERTDTGEAVVIEGNPDMTLKFISDASKNKWCWSSGVLTFEESLDDDVLREIIEDFKRVTFPGLEPEQYDCLIVKHEDKGRSELHYVIPRMELSTGKAFNPYFVSKDFVKKDLFQQFINVKYGLSNPLDPEKRSLVAKKQKKWQKGKPSLKKQIDELLQPFIDSGDVASRADVVEKLREFGLELGDNPTKRKYIVIIDPNDPKETHRLKGEIYSPDFSGLPDLKKKIEADAVKQGYGRPLAEIEKNLQKFIDRDAKYNLKRYKGKDNGNSTTTDYPGKESRAISQRRDHRRALSEHNSRIEELDRVRIDSIDRVEAVAEQTAANTDGEPAKAISIDRSDEIDRLINETERRIEENLDFTEQNYRAIAETRRDSQLRRGIKRSISSVISELADELVSRVGEITDKLKELKEAIKEAIEKKEEEYQVPEIKSVLTDDNEAFVSPDFTPQKP